MKKSVKAALFSALVFPGAGHFVLRRYARGMMFFLPATLAFLFVANKAVSKALAIADKVLQGEVPLDAEAIATLVYAGSNASESMMMNVATFVMLACWVAGIIDSWRIGAIEDKAGANAGPSP